MTVSCFRCLIRLSLIAQFILFSLPSQSAPIDAGVIHQERSRQAQSKSILPREETSKGDVLHQLERASGAVEADTRVWVAGYEIHGNTRLTPEQTRQVLAPFTDAQLTLGEIHRAAAVLQERYIESGYFAAEVVIPPQALTSHIVVLHVYEGVLAEQGVYLVNNAKRVSNKTVERILQTQLTAGVPMQARDFERAILLSGDLPGISAHASLLPGEEVGQAVFQMETFDTPLLQGDIRLDNFGGYFTGEARLGATLIVDSPSRRGDRLMLNAVTSGSRSNYLFMQYDLPVAGDGVRLGASVDYLSYELGKEYKALNAKGDGSELRFFGSYPLQRARHANLYGNITFSHLDLHDESDLDGLTDRQVDALIVGLIGDRESDIIRDGEFYYAAALTVGRLDISGSDAFTDFDRQFVHSEGSFAKLEYEIARLQHLSGPLSAYASFNGQLANQNLDTSQKFFIGGPFDVAGYPVGELSGDEGALLHLDLRYDFHDVLGHSETQISLFYAHGWARLYNTTWPGWEGGNDQIVNRITLKTVGLSSYSTWQGRYLLHLIVGRQIGDNPGSDPLTGEDNDHSDSDYRAWIQGAYLF